MRPNLLAQFTGEAPPFTMWTARLTVDDGTQILLSTGDLKTILDARRVHNEGKLLVYTGVQNNA